MEEQEKHLEHIRELRKKAMRLPLHPGVYIMHDKTGKIIYIGKAKALKTASASILAVKRTRQKSPPDGQQRGGL